MKQEYITRLRLSLDELYGLMYHADPKIVGSGVRSGLQSFLKKHEIPYNNYVAMILRDSKWVDTVKDGRECILHYARNKKITNDECLDILRDAKAMADAANRKETPKVSTDDIRRDIINEAVGKLTEDLKDLDQQLEDIEALKERLLIKKGSINYAVQAIKDTI